MTIKEALDLGVREHRAGKQREAEEIYRQIIAAQPDQPDALHLLGMLLCGRGDYAAGAELIGRAVALAPQLPIFHGSLGVALMRLHRPEEAAVEYRRVIELSPELAQAHNDLGSALLELGRSEEAETCFRKAAELAPALPNPPYNLGNVLRNSGRLDEAIREYQKAICLRPDWAEAHNNLGLAYKAKLDFDSAIQSLEKSLAITPRLAVAWINLTMALCDVSEFERAILAGRKAVELAPNEADAHGNLGIALSNAGEHNEAIQCFQRSLTLRPHYAIGFGNLGVSLRETGKLDEAAAAFGEHLRLTPENTRLYWELLEIGLLKSAAAGQASIPFPFIGDKVVLLRCDRSTRERLRRSGLHGGYAVNPKTGADYWLESQAAYPDAGRMKLWLEWLRNEAAMAGAIATVWLADMPEGLANAVRQSAGPDLIEVSGASEPEIRDCLAAHSIPLPDTHGKIFTIVSIRNGGLELLPHWLEHYSRLGADKILIGIFEDVGGETREQIEELARPCKAQIFPQQWQGASETEQYAQRQSVCRRAGALPGTWIMHTDLDEFQQYPRPLREIVRAAEEKGMDAVFGDLSDRVAADGSLPAIRETPSIWEQFPIECPLTEHIFGGVTAKVMLARFRLHVTSGHHSTTGHARTQPPLGTADDYRVAHFRWHGELVPRLRWALREQNSSSRWKAEARQFLAWLDKSGGKINLADPILEATRKEPRS